ncbi:PREDICTED: uncharacterized protein LOC104612385 [Nelumbo nucifera]|uniref:Uncharacterized protein LOC104612385 n=2 Tax=Nelumbo nucifera TaxID=4432 RepID=A0A1U8BLC5_NELNU|nr:PREDICTED: uncharacterized protein LOC104612385 [Nelumbo nucifera]DAD27594.1 TPA_asm: hypothetical protein HUJ06_029062 [Nelumbo nucifera]
MVSLGMGTESKARRSGPTKNARALLKEIRSMKLSDHLGVMGILRESFAILKKNGMLTASITFLTILPNTLLFLLHHFSVKQLVVDLVLKIMDVYQEAPGSPEYMELVEQIRRDIGILMLKEAIFKTAMWLVFLFSVTGTVYASAMTYTGMSLTLKELILRIRATWTGPAITWFYVSLLILGCSLLALAPVGLFTMVSTGSSGSIALSAFSLLLVLLLLLVSLYLSSVWIVGLVVSIIEDGCYGLEAIGKAEELMKGSRLQGCVLTLLCVTVLIPISGILGSIIGNTAFTEATQLGIASLLMSIACLLKIFGSTVFTLFYYQCNIIPGEKVEMKQGTGYIMIPSVPYVAEALPC